MSFRLSYFIVLAASLVIGAFFCFIGSYIFILPWSASLQEKAMQFVLEKTFIPMLYGLGFILAGIFLIFFTLWQLRHRFVQVRIGTLAITLDENVIRKYLDSYWKEYFPSENIFYTISFKKKALEITAELPPLPYLEQKHILEQIKDDFSDLFSRILGYPYDVHLFANFRIRKESDECKNSDI